MKSYLGIELGSTRIKAVSIDEKYRLVSSGDYTWASSYENSVWTYSLEEVWKGLKAALSAVENREQIAAAGVSAMMHGYLAFDRDWNLLVPFRTWQNTITGQAAAELTSLFGFISASGGGSGQAAEPSLLGQGTGVPGAFPAVLPYHNRRGTGEPEAPERHAAFAVPGIYGGVPVTTCKRAPRVR